MRYCLPAVLLGLLTAGCGLFGSDTDQKTATFQVEGALSQARVHVRVDTLKDNGLVQLPWKASFPVQSGDTLGLTINHPGADPRNQSPSNGEVTASILINKTAAQQEIKHMYPNMQFGVFTVVE